MEDFEKLGAFYLGRVQDLAAGKRTDELVLYDSKDLTTHAVIIGMTGSGKTGLGIGMIEEAAIDRIPVIAIDPKGDLGDLLLYLSRTAAGRLRAVGQSAGGGGEGTDSRSSSRRSRRATWEKGLADWGQSGGADQAAQGSGRLRDLHAGQHGWSPISVLRAFTAPPEAVRNDADLFRERLQTTASSVLGAARHRCRSDHESRAHPGVEHPPAGLGGGEGPRPRRPDRADPEPAVREGRRDAGGPGLSREGSQRRSP